MHQKFYHKKSKTLNILISWLYELIITVLKQYLQSYYKILIISPHLNTRPLPNFRQISFEKSSVYKPFYHNSLIGMCVYQPLYNFFLIIIYSINSALSLDCFHALKWAHLMFFKGCCAQAFLHAENALCLFSISFASSYFL